MKTFKEWCQTTYGIQEIAEAPNKAFKFVYAIEANVPARYSHRVLKPADGSIYDAIIREFNMTPGSPISGFIVPASTFLDPGQYPFTHPYKEPGPVYFRMANNDFGKLSNLSKTCIINAHLGFDPLTGQMNAVQAPSVALDRLYQGYEQYKQEEEKKSSAKEPLSEEELANWEARVNHLIELFKKHPQLSSYVHKAHHLSKDLPNEKAADTNKIFQAASGYSLSLQIYAELNKDLLGSKEYNDLQYAIQILGKEENQGLKSDANLMHYLVRQLGDRTHVKLDDKFKAHGLPDYVPIAQDQKPWIVVNPDDPKQSYSSPIEKRAVYPQLKKHMDENLENILNGNESVKSWGAFSNRKPYKIKRFLPDEQNQSETNEIVLQGGRMINHSAMFKIIKIGIQENGNITKDPSKIAYFKYYHVQTNLGAESNERSGNICTGTYVTELQPTQLENNDENGRILPLPNVNPEINHPSTRKAYQKGMETTIRELIRAERHLLFYRKPEAGPNEEGASPANSPEAHEWARWNERLNAVKGKPLRVDLSYITENTPNGQYRRIQNQRNFIQDNGSCTIFSIKQLVHSTIGPHLTAMHNHFLQKTPAKEQIDALNKLKQNIVTRRENLKKNVFKPIVPKPVVPETVKPRAALNVSQHAKMLEQSKYFIKNPETHLETNDDLGKSVDDILTANLKKGEAVIFQYEDNPDFVVIAMKPDAAVIMELVPIKEEGFCFGNKNYFQIDNCVEAIAQHHTIANVQVSTHYKPAVAKPKVVEGAPLAYADYYEKQMAFLDRYIRKVNNPEDAARKKRINELKSKQRIDFMDEFLNVEPGKELETTRIGYKPYPSQTYSPQDLVLAPENFEINEENRRLTRYRFIQGPVDFYLGKQFDKPTEIDVMTTCAPNLMGTSQIDLDEFTSAGRLNEDQYRAFAQKQAEKIVTLIGDRRLIMPTYGLGVYIAQVNPNANKSNAYQIMYTAFAEAAQKHKKRIDWVVYGGGSDPQAEKARYEAYAPGNAYIKPIITSDMLTYAKEEIEKGERVIVLNPGSDRALGGLYNHKEKSPDGGLTLPKTLEEQIAQQSDLICLHSTLNEDMTARFQTEFKEKQAARTLNLKFPDELFRLNPTVAKAGVYVSVAFDNKPDEEKFIQLLIANSVINNERAVIKPDTTTVHLTAQQWNKVPHLKSIKTLQENEWALQQERAKNDHVAKNIINKQMGIDTFPMIVKKQDHYAISFTDKSYAAQFSDILLKNKIAEANGNPKFLQKNRGNRYVVHLTMAEWDSLPNIGKAFDQAAIEAEKQRLEAEKLQKEQEARKFQEENHLKTLAQSIHNILKDILEVAAVKNNPPFIRYVGADAAYRISFTAKPAAEAFSQYLFDKGIKSAKGEKKDVMTDIKSKPAYYFLSFSKEQSNALDTLFAKPAETKIESAEAEQKKEQEALEMILKQQKAKEEQEINGMIQHIRAELYYPVGDILNIQKDHNSNYVVSLSTDTQGRNFTRFLFDNGIQSLSVPGQPKNIRENTNTKLFDVYLTADDWSRLPKATKKQDTAIKPDTRRVEEEQQAEAEKKRAEQEELKAKQEAMRIQLLTTKRIEHIQNELKLKEHVNVTVTTSPKGQMYNLFFKDEQSAKAFTQFLADNNVLGSNGSLKNVFPETSGYKVILYPTQWESLLTYKSHPPKTQTQDDLKTDKEVEQKRMAEEQKRREAEQKRLAEEQKRREAEQKRLAEEQKRREAEQKRLAEEQKHREAEQKRLAEEQKRLDDEQKRRDAEQNPDLSPEQQALLAKLEKRITLLKEKVDELKDETDPISIDKHRAVKELHDFFNEDGKAFLSSKITPENYNDFKKQLQGVIDRNKESLNKDRNWGNIILNIVAMVLSCFVGYALAAGINVAVKGRFTLFSTDSYEKALGTKDLIDNEVSEFINKK